jgi:hypothetical protein
MTNDATFQTLRRIVLACSAVAAFGDMILYTVLENAYVNYPRVPDQGSGRVVPHHVKSVTVFITVHQSETIHSIEWILGGASVLIFISLLVNLKWPLRRAT